MELNSTELNFFFFFHLKTHTLWDLDSVCSFRAGISPPKLRDRIASAFSRDAEETHIAGLESNKIFSRFFRLGLTRDVTSFPEWKPWIAPDTYPSISLRLWTQVGAGVVSAVGEDHRANSVLLRTPHSHSWTILHNSCWFCVPESLAVACCWHAGFFWPGQLQTVSSEYQSTKEESWLVLTQQVND